VYIKGRKENIFRLKVAENITFKEFIGFVSIKMEKEKC